MRRLRPYAPLLICGWFVLLAALYSRALPVFESTDESAHFLYIHNLLESGQLPVIGTRLEVTGDADPAQRWSLERHQPPLYYAVGALLIAGTERADLGEYLDPNQMIFLRGITAHNHNMWLHRPAYSGDTGTAVALLRAFGVLLGAGTLLLIHRSARLACGSESLALLAMAFAASIPMFVAISASVNNDTLMNLLYSAGVYWLLRVWRRAAVTRLDIVALSLILAAAALTKLTGLTLFGVVFAALILGAWRGRYARRSAARALGAALLAAGLLAGWWYARNLNLYGDPLASAVTYAIMGRKGAPPDLPGEALRVWRSFWLGVGHLHHLAYGPAWLYVYTGALALAALAGVLRLWLREPARRMIITLLLLVCAAALAGLIAGTRDIDISYGRMLFPALAATAALAVLGWRALLGRWLGGIVWLPLAAFALIAPFSVIPAAYPTLETMQALPADAVPLQAQAESLALEGYALREAVAAPGDAVRLWLYFRGQHADNPTLFVRAVDALSGETLGQTELYPGMTPLSQVNSETLHRAQVDMTLGADLPPAHPRQIRLLVRWMTILPARPLIWTQADSPQSDVLALDGPLLVDARYQPAAPQVAADVVYGEALRLRGYTLSAQTAAPGETLTITPQWAALRTMDTEWTLAVGLLDAQNNVLVNADGAVPGYPTRLWQVGAPFDDPRALTIPPDAPPGEYRLYLGWYRLSDGERLPPRGTHVEGTLYIAPTAITVTG